MEDSNLYYQLEDEFFFSLVEKSDVGHNLQFNFFNSLILVYVIFINLGLGNLFLYF